MAEWKKLVVSGSNISQLNNNAGYLTAGTITQANGYATASVNGVELIANSATASLAFSPSSSQGLTIAATSPGGVNTLSFGLTAIPNTSLANSSVTIGSTNIALGSTASTLDGLTSVIANSFTGSLSGNVAGTASYATLATTALSANSATSASYATVASSSLFATSASHADLLDGLTATAFVLNSQTSSMTVLSASYADNALTASFALNTPNAGNANTASNITPAITNEADNRVLTANGGGTINGEANLTFDGTTLNLNGSQIIAGDLTVNGTTTTINTQNLNVADKFILLSSGSTSANDGGIIIQSAVGGTGFAFLYDQGQARWAYTGSLSATASTASPDAFAAMVIDLNVAESTDKAVYQKNGNIKIEVGGDIYIYA